jgi:mercuric ion transport protein
LNGPGRSRALVAAGAVGAVLAAICCAAPLLAAAVPLAALGAWLAHAGLMVISLVILAGLALAAWVLHRRRARTAGCETRTHKEGAKS